MKIIFFLFLLLSVSIFSQEPENEQKESGFENIKSNSIEVKGIRERQSSSSEGKISSEKIKSRAIQSPGEIAETIPGVIVTQHSGGGKANQYFLRGFSVDHGTDFASSIDGIGINNPGHAHGQGYNDLNFIIPELVQEIKYRKGVYNVEDGDFSSAGSMHMTYYKTLEKGKVNMEGGSYGHRRVLAMNSTPLGKGNLIYALEYSNFNGPWTIPDRFRKLNSVIGYSIGDESLGFSMQATGYRGSWHATNQIPERAEQKGKSWIFTDNGGLNRFDAADTTDMGKSQRGSLNTEIHRITKDSEAKVMLYAVYYDLDLYSNFTYYLSDPERGDQIRQKEIRSVTGGKASYKLKSEIFGLHMDNTVGVHTRRDYVQNELNHTESLYQLEALKTNRLIITSVSPYYENQIHWMEKFKTVLGIRSETYLFNVGDRINYDEVKNTSSLLTPKGGFIIGPWYQTDFFFNAGRGFHSNDPRGLLEKTNQVTTLAGTKGMEAGIKSGFIKNFMMNLTFWKLNLESELVYSGDSGTTEPGRPSVRKGVEWSGQYNILPYLQWEMDLSLSKANYTKYDPSGDSVPQSARTVASSAIILNKNDHFASIRVRYFGPRPLNEDDTVRSSASTLWSFQYTKNFLESWSFRFEVYNLLNAPYNQIQYYYPTRLKQEPIGPDDGGYNDRLFHPGIPRSFKFALTMSF